MMRVQSQQLVLLLCMFLAACQQTSQADQGGTASIGSRTFPASVKVGDWASDSGAQEYGLELMIQSGGIGLGFAVLFSICMLFHMACWGQCCDCCRCCCCRVEKTRSKCGFKRSMRKWWLVAAVVLFMSACAGVAIIFFNSSTLYSDIDSLMGNIKTTIQDTEDFLCAGNVTAQLRAGSSLESLKASSGGTAGLIQSCEGSSVGEYLSGSNDRINGTFDGIISMIDTMQGIITALNASIESAQNVSAQTSTINSTLYLLDGISTDMGDALDAIYATGITNTDIPQSSELPALDATDRISPAATVIAIDESIVSMKSARASVLPTISTSLGVTARNSASSARGTIYTELVKINDQLLDNLDTLVEQESKPDDWNDSAQKTKFVGQYALPVIYALSVFFMFLMIFGYVCKRKWPICVGAYSTFFFFAFLCIVLGLFLFLSMIVYDVCGCEGTYTTAGCGTMMTLIRTNVGSSTMSIGDTKVNVSDVVTDILNCPVRKNATKSYIHSTTSNFVDIMGIRTEFNFTADVQKTINDLSAAIPLLDVNSTVDYGKGNVTLAKNTMAQVAVGATYNFTDDNISYVNLRQGLTGGSASTYYTGAFSATTNNANIDRLDYLIPNNTVFESYRDTLLVQKQVYNNSADQLNTDLESIRSSVNNAKVSLNNATNNINDLVDYVLDINLFTPCGFVGKAYSTIVVGDFCETFFGLLDGVVPGAILCMVSVLLAFFLLLVMRDCVILHHQERIEPADIKAPGRGLGEKRGDSDAEIELAGLPGEVNNGYEDGDGDILEREVSEPAPVGETTEDGKPPI